MHRQVRQVAALAAALALGACPSAPQRSPPPATAAGGDAGTGAFQASLTGPGRIAAGSGGELVVEVSARQGFHVNDDYPHAFRPTPAEGVQFGADKFDLRQGWERTPCASEPDHACTFRAKVPFKATDKGQRRAEGVVAFSVCNPEICLIEKVPVSAVIEATGSSPTP